MKTLKHLLLVCTCFFCMAASCKKKASENPIDNLPALTQTGANTFGCLVNGQAFIPKGSSLGGPTLSGFYQYLNSPTAQGYFFNISCNRRESGKSILTLAFLMSTIMLLAQRNPKNEILVILNRE